MRGILYTALAVSNGETMQRFRQALYEEIVSTMDIMTGTPSAEAVRYRERCIQLFFGRFSGVAGVLARLMPNGDSRVRDRVQYYLPATWEGTVTKKTKHSIAGFSLLPCLKHTCRRSSVFTPVTIGRA